MTVPVTVRVTLPVVCVDGGGPNDYRWKVQVPGTAVVLQYINKPGRNTQLMSRNPHYTGIHLSSVTSEKVANRDLPMYGQNRKEEWGLQSNYVKLRYDYQSVDVKSVFTNPIYMKT
jgi:hypothetical protein